MGSSTRLGIVGFLVILALIFYVYTVHVDESKQTGKNGTGTVASTDTHTGTGTGTAWWVPTGSTPTAVGTASPDATATAMATATSATAMPLPTGTGRVDAAHPTGTSSSGDPLSTGTGAATGTGKGTGTGTVPVTPEYREYVIRKDDTLWSIARKFYGKGRLHPKIAEANLDRIPNPNKLPIGVTIRIPNLDQATEPPATEYEIYIVKPGETLSSIAHDKLGSEHLWKEIFRLNREKIPDANNIKPGLKIRLPKSR